MQTAETTRAEGLALIPLDRLFAEEGHNPREHVDREAQAELVASVARDGVLQPILVRPGDDGYLVVAGHRRLAAARQAGLTEIPALVRETGEEASALALLENVARADLSPLEEARALARVREREGLHIQKALAERLGRSESWVSVRLRLLELPEACRAAVADGTLPLAAVAVLGRIAAVSKQVAEKIAELSQDGEIAAQEVTDEPGRALDQARQAGAFCAPAEWFRIREGNVEPWDRGGVVFPEADAERMTRCATEHGVDLRFESFHLTDDDLDQARAYGCLIDLGEDHGAWVCDPAWLSDRILAEIAGRAEARREQVARATGGALRDQPTDDGRGDDELSPEKQAAARAQMEKDVRERERAARRGAYLANTKLGIELARALHSPELSPEIARVLARCVSWKLKDALGADGLRLCAPGWQEERGAGISYPKRREAAARVETWLCEPKTAGEILGRIVQALAAAAFASGEAVSRSGRGFIPVERELGPGALVGLYALVEGLLPPALRAGAKERAQRAEDLLGPRAHEAPVGPSREPGESRESQSPPEDEAQGDAAPSDADTQAHLDELIGLAGVEACAARFPMVAFTGEPGERQVAVSDLSEAQARWIIAQLEASLPMGDAAA